VASNADILSITATSDTATMLGASDTAVANGSSDTVSLTGSGDAATAHPHGYTILLLASGAIEIASNQTVTIDYTATLAATVSGTDDTVTLDAESKVVGGAPPSAATVASSMARTSASPRPTVRASSRSAPRRQRLAPESPDSSARPDRAVGAGRLLP